MANFDIESDILKNGNYKYICGIDEAGRGPWAGPVVAAAVILDINNLPIGVDDSKKLNAKKRAIFFEEIIKSSIAIGIGIIEAKEIDEINILQATYKAMKIAVKNLKIMPEYCLIDGNRDPHIGIKSDCIVKGDSKSISIAAASIIAKQTRDKIMNEANNLYPQYGFNKNAGYGVPFHINALNEFGPCPIHRLSYKPVKIFAEKFNYCK